MEMTVPSANKDLLMLPVSALIVAELLFVLVSPSLSLPAKSTKHSLPKVDMPSSPPSEVRWIVISKWLLVDLSLRLWLATRRR